MRRAPSRSSNAMVAGPTGMGGTGASGARGGRRPSGSIVSPGPASPHRPRHGPDGPRDIPAAERHQFEDRVRPYLDYPDGQNPEGMDAS